MSQSQLPVFDQGHPLVQEVPAFLSTSVIDGPAGQRLALTIRVPNTTVSVILVKDDAERWAEQIRSAVAQMHGLIIGGQVPPSPPGPGLNGHPR